MWLVLYYDLETVCISAWSNSRRMTALIVHDVGDSCKNPVKSLDLFDQSKVGVAARIPGTPANKEPATVAETDVKGYVNALPSVPSVRLQNFTSRSKESDADLSHDTGGGLDFREDVDSPYPSASSAATRDENNTTSGLVRFLLFI
jgi:hypothetical protein